MFKKHMFSNYIILKKSSLCVAALMAFIAVAWHYYKYHRTQLKEGLSQVTDDVTDAAKVGVQKVREVVNEAKM